MFKERVKVLFYNFIILKLFFYSLMVLTKILNVGVRRVDKKYGAVRVGEKVKKNGYFCKLGVFSRGENRERLIFLGGRKGGGEGFRVYSCSMER